jgi:hypothetical protein
MIALPERIVLEAGHGIGSTKTQLEIQRADEWSSLLWERGIPRFSPL